MASKSSSSLSSSAKQIRRLSLQRSVAQQVVSSHSLTCLNSVRYGHSSAGNISSMPPVSTCSNARPQLRDIPIIRNARNCESREFNDQFRRVCEGVQDSEGQKDESVLRVALKLAMENSGSMDWNHHNEDIKWFFESFNLMSGSMVDFTHDERDRKYLVISEAEWASLRVYGFLRSPRASEDGSASPTVHPVMMFSLVSDAVNCHVYLKVAHQFAHGTKSDAAGGKHVIMSGVMCNEVKDTAWQNELRAGIHHIFMPYGQDDIGQAHFSKLMLHEYLKHITVWSSSAELFHYNQSALGFTNQDVLFFMRASQSALMSSQTPCSA